LYSDYRLVLPPTVGRVGSLNLSVALVGRSGTGKGAAQDEASALLGEPKLADDYKIDESTVGSGEGMVQAFTEIVTIKEDGPVGNQPKTRHVRRQTKQGLLVRIDEGETLEKLGQRSGQTTMQVFRQGFSGEKLGQAYASEDKKVTIPAHGYRMAVVMAIQPERAGFLFEDVSGGTPQPFLWLSTVDPALPDDLPRHPGKLPWTPPTLDPQDISPANELSQTREMTLAKPIIAELWRQARARVRGETDEIDGHSALVRLKVAALLAILDGRLDVNSEDWHLAEMVSKTSEAVRTWTHNEISRAAATKQLASNQRAVQREIAIEDGKSNAKEEKVERVARYLVRHIERHGPTTIGKLRAAVMSRERKLADEALVLALDLGSLVEHEGAYHLPASALEAQARPNQKKVS
jgi:hypothetical protein